MKCSNCAFWKTDGCKTNPDEVDFNNAQDFACFVHDPDAKARRVAEGVLIETRPDEEVEIDIRKQLQEATHARNRALGWGSSLLIGGFISLYAGFGFGFHFGWTLQGIYLIFGYIFLILGGIAAISGVVLLLGALMGFASCASLRRRVKQMDAQLSPQPTDEPAEE